MTKTKLACCSLAAVLIALRPAWADDGKPPASPPYAVAHDAPLESAEAMVAVADDHTQFRVEFNGIKGDRVPAFLYVPKDKAPKRPAVLLQYGIGGNKKTDYIVALGKQFVAHGFVVLTIDSPLRGERAPKEKKKVDFFLSDFGRDIFLQYCGDYSRSVDYLLSRPDVDAELRVIIRLRNHRLSRFERRVMRDLVRRRRRRLGVIGPRRAQQDENGGY